MAAPTQHRVLRQLTEALGAALERGLKECTGKAIPVHFAYDAKVVAKSPCVTLVNYWVERVNDRNPSRVECKDPKTGEEYFREAPLALSARYLVTGWAAPPEDQELLMAAMRYLYDTVTLPKDEALDAIPWEEMPPTPELSQRLTLDETRMICESQGMPLRPSLRYDVQFRLDSERKTPIKRVRERIIDYRKA